MFEIDLAPALDHENADTVIWLGVGETETPIGTVRATATCVVEIGGHHLSIKEARELADVIRSAARAADVWRDKLSGRSSYKVTRDEKGTFFCEHMGKRGPLRRSQFRKRQRSCCSCCEPFNALWVPVHKPWNRHNEVGAELCDKCLHTSLVEERGGLRLVGEEARSA